MMLPENPVSLIVAVNDRTVDRVFANNYREDLELARIGSGYHSFEVTFPKPLSPVERHVIRVVGEIDGIDIPGSPAILEPPSTPASPENQSVATDPDAPV